MARTRNALFTPKVAWDTNILRGIPEMETWSARSTENEFFSEFHDPAVTYTGLCTTVAKALSELVKGKDSKIALVSVGKDSFAAEMKREDGTTNIIYLPQNGKAKACIVHETGRYESWHSIGGAATYPSEIDDLTLCMAVCIAKTINVSNSINNHFIEMIKEYTATKTYLKKEAYIISDAVYYAIQGKQVKFLAPGGNIDMLTEHNVTSGALNGVAMIGEPVLLKGKAAISVTNGTTFKDAKNMFQKWSSRVAARLTEAEKKLIPVFEEDAIVPEEALRLAKCFVESNSTKIPIVNVGWRGVTGYGKSTGIRMMAGFLGMPLLIVTCDPQMERQDFLSQFVPCTSKEFTGEFPTFEEIRYAPEDAYERMTGEFKENVTPDEVFEIYTEALKQEGSKEKTEQRYKLVESNYIKALAKGYIVEIQEFSVPKNPGTLVSINEYDRPGAVIPLADGTSTIRHPEAFCIFTDNVGYNGRRPVDQSVIRRLSIIIDSNDMPKEDVIKRVKHNTGFDDDDLLDKMYDVWTKIQKHCADRDISDGSVSVCELETWAMAVIIDGYTRVYENAITCVVSKATAEFEDQQDIISSILAIELI